MVTDVGFANRGADDLGVEAVYSRDRAIGHKQTLAPGYDIDTYRPIPRPGPHWCGQYGPGSNPKSAVKWRRV